MIFFKSNHFFFHSLSSIRKNICAARLSELHYTYCNGGGISSKYLNYLESCFKAAFDSVRHVEFGWVRDLLFS